MQASPKPPRGDKAMPADPRYVRDYWRAYKDAWEVAWQFAPTQCGHDGVEAMRAWTDDIAHTVAKDYAEVQNRWR